MKIFLFGLFIILVSCSPKVVPIKGSYPKQPIELKSDKNYEQVWSSLIDIFAQNGISIKIIDKSSGLIISDKYEMIATFEDENGVPKNKEAFIVVPKMKLLGQLQPITGLYYDSELKRSRTNPMLASWNVRIKPVENGTTINVNIVNVSIKDKDLAALVKPSELKYVSTGVFENLISNSIK